MPGNKDKVLKPSLIRIGELSRASGVSIPTIHYYIKEGLLAAPVIASRNMAYYDPVCVDEIKFIKELQSKRFLPLSIIKLMLAARREGQEPGHLLEMGDFFTGIFHPVETEHKASGFSFLEIMTESGLPESVLTAIEKWGLVMPEGSGKNKRYDDIDLHIAKMVKELVDCGLTTKELSIYSEYVRFVRHEFNTIHDKVHELHGKSNVPIKRLNSAVLELRHSLDANIRRRFALESHIDIGIGDKEK